jgi:tetratricopeptide (TPR) repeat protein
VSVGRVAWSGDSRLVAASLADRTVRVWLHERRSEIGRLSSGTGGQARPAAQQIAFVTRPGKADGYALVAGDAAGDVRLWEVYNTPVEKERDRLVAQVCSRLRRSLTAEEWALYFRTEVYERTCPGSAMNLSDVLGLQIGFARMKDADNAKVAFKLPARESSAEPSAALSAAAAQFNIGNTDESRELYRLAANLVLKRNVADPEKAKMNNNVCWQGAIRTFATEVLDACDEAVKLAPMESRYRDSRGIALAQLGNTTAAIADFEAYVDAGKGNRRPDDIAKRVEWIKGLKDNQNPFVRDRDRLLDDLRGDP